MNEMSDSRHTDYSERDWFKQADGTDLVWRYIDFSQYVNLLTTDRTWFSRVDQFDDPHEGMPSAKTHRESSEDEDTLTQKFEDIQQWVYASCWHRNPVQSDGMWKLYLSSDTGVAIQSTVDELRTAFTTDHDLFFARVNYIDWDNDVIPLSPVIAPSLHKRKSFQHEREFRVVLRHEEWKPEPYHPYGKPITGTGLPITTSLDDLIQKVYTAPKADEWFHSTVEKITEEYVDAPVIKSDLYHDVSSREGSPPAN